MHPIAWQAGQVLKEELYALGVGESRGGATIILGQIFVHVNHELMPYCVAKICQVST